MTPVTRRFAALCAAALSAPALLLAAGSPAHAVTALTGNPANGNTANAHPQTGGRCAPVTARKVAGTLIAPGDLGIDATIGVDLLDRNGTKINVLNGCPSGGAYGAVVQLNHYVGKSGQTIGTEEHNAKGQGVGVVDPDFAVLNLPANVTQVFVEVYNRYYTGSPCGRSCAGLVDQTHFSQVNERSLTPGPATANLKLVPEAITSTGALKLEFNRSDIARVDIFSFTKAASSNAWSIAGPEAGSGSGRASTWIAPALPTDAKNGYLVEATLNDGEVIHVPDFLKGATSGYRTRKGETTVEHVVLP